jgi:triphosphoribosyl-dephospho-CoA synthase
MDRSADVDGIAAEWTNSFERTFHAADRLLALDGPVQDRAARVFLELLAAEPDTFIATQHDWATAEDATERANSALEGKLSAGNLADEFVAEEINPGTTADLTAAALFVALERGLDV